MALSSTKRNRQRGQGLVEFAMLLPVLMLILMSILDFGRAIYAYSVVANSAREGARFAITGPVNPDDIITVVQNAAIGLDMAQLTVSVTYPGEDLTRVEVNYTLLLITPLVSQIVSTDGSVVLHSSATMYGGYDYG